MKLLILNGPNLNLLGSREPDIYGRESYDMLCQQIYRHADTIGCTVEVFQSNHEGTLIDAIQAAQAGYSGIVINPGAYAHYSYAIYDALRALPEGARVLADSATANSRGRTGGRGTHLRYHGAGAVPGGVRHGGGLRQDHLRPWTGGVSGGHGLPDGHRLRPER